MAGWLTTIVARVCLDQLRSRRSRHEEPIGEQLRESASDADPEPAGHGGAEPGDAGGDADNYRG